MNGRQLLEDMVAILPAGAGRLDRFVLAHGREYQPAKLPSDFRRMRPKLCFQNCASLVTRKSGLIYVEGHGYMSNIPIPIHHAWCVREGSLDVIDPTTDAFDYYFGVPFKTGFVRRHVKEYAGMSLLDNWHNGWPVLRAADAELADMLYPGTAAVV